MEGASGEGNPGPGPGLPPPEFDGLFPDVGWELLGEARQRFIIAVLHQDEEENRIHPPRPSRKERRRRRKAIKDPSNDDGHGSKSDDLFEQPGPQFDMLWCEIDESTRSGLSPSQDQRSIEDKVCQD